VNPKDNEVHCRCPCTCEHKGECSWCGLTNLKDDADDVRINHPPHYAGNGIEAIDVIEAWGLGFCLGNVVKYIARADHKGAPVEDLEKAAWYLQREIERRKRC
jgi:Protein of unknwon function (DUF3310)